MHACGVPWVRVRVCGVSASARGLRAGCVLCGWCVCVARYGARVHGTAPRVYAHVARGPVCACRPWRGRSWRGRACMHAPRAWCRSKDAAAHVHCSGRVGCEMFWPVDNPQQHPRVDRIGHMSMFGVASGCHVVRPVMWRALCRDMCSAQFSPNITRTSRSERPSSRQRTWQLDAENNLASFL